MSLNFDKIGRPLAKINGSGRLKNQVVSVDDKDECQGYDDVKTFSSFQLKNNDKFSLIPSDKERDVLYIVGQSGSGKSTFASGFIKEYKKKHKNNPVYIISNVNEDKVLDDIPNIKRIDVDETLYEDPIDYNNFKDCLVLFDDDASIGDKKIKEAVLTLKNQLLECGRHNNCSVICISHMASAGIETKKMLLEANMFVYFPHSGAGRNLTYVLTDYIGLDHKQIKEIKQMKTRWACVFKNYPMIAMTEQKIFLLNSDDEEKKHEQHPPSAYKPKRK